jgi:hypothetical protein
MDVRAHDLGIRSKMVLPEAVAKNDHVPVPGLIFGGSEEPSEHRSNLEDGKEIR